MVAAIGHVQHRVILPRQALGKFEGRLGERTVHGARLAFLGAHHVAYEAARPLADEHAVVKRVRNCQPLACERSGHVVCELKASERDCALRLSLRRGAGGQTRACHGVCTRKRPALDDISKYARTVLLSTISVALRAFYGRCEWSFRRTLVWMCVCVCVCVLVRVCLCVCMCVEKQWHNKEITTCTQVHKCISARLLWSWRKQKETQQRQRELLTACDIKMFQETTVSLVIKLIRYGFFVTALQNQQFF